MISLLIRTYAVIIIAIENKPTRLQLRDRKSIEGLLPAIFPAFIDTGCVRISLGVRFKNEVVRRRRLAADSWSAIVRERTGVANATIKLGTLYSVRRARAESVKRSLSAKCARLALISRSNDRVLRMTREIKIWDLRARV